MPETTISTPDHAASVIRMTLGVASVRGESAAPSSAPTCAYPFCSADDE